MTRFEETFFEYFDTLRNQMRVRPLILGGGVGVDGGVGGPPGGFIGQLPQSKVAYDLTEAETFDTVSGSLVNNLNRIRYRIKTLESGNLTYLQSGVLVSSGVTVVDVYAPIIAKKVGPKKIKLFLSGVTNTDADAVHVNVANEINQIAEKVTPVTTDILIIEDSEDNNTKKKVQIGNLPISGGGGGGGGDSTFSSTYSTRPSPSNNGDLFFPTDGFVVERDNGVSWKPWGPLFPLDPKPVLSDFTWVNQGSATAVDDGGGIYMFTPALGGDNIRILKKAAPSTPYTITACLLVNITPNNYSAVGIGVRDSSSGNLITLSYVYNNGFGFDPTKFNSPSSWNSTYTHYTYGYSPFIFLRIKDDGTNRYYYYSVDGQNFIEIYNTPRTDFITPDEVFMFVNSNNGNYPAAATFLMWKET